MPDAPALLLAKKWEGQSLVGWHLSEKLDGVRALWDGQKFVTRLGNTYNAPAWFTADFPLDSQLDGELWMGRGRFSDVISCVKKNVPVDAQWKQIRFLVFDVPFIITAVSREVIPLLAPFEERIKYVEGLAGLSTYIEAVPQLLCKSDDEFLRYMDSVIAGGGEGLMAREPGSFYIGKRSSTLLKIKRMQDAEATVYAYQPGEGKHTGRMGALMCRFDNGVEFKIGTGFSDFQRENPPAIGTLVTVRYQELSKDGVPRFPAFVGARDYE